MLHCSWNSRIIEPKEHVEDPNGTSVAPRWCMVLCFLRFAFQAPCSSNTPGGPERNTPKAASRTRAAPDQLLSTDPLPKKGQQLLSRCSWCPTPLSLPFGQASPVSAPSSYTSGGSHQQRSQRNWCGASDAMRPQTKRGSRRTKRGREPPAERLKRPNGQSGRRSLDWSVGWSVFRSFGVHNSW